MSITLGIKNWTIAQLQEDVAVWLANECDIPLPVARILASRGITDSYEANRFLFGGFDEDSPHGDFGTVNDPFSFEGMRGAALRINEAINNGEKICVYGDYDVDGVTSTALLLRYLRARGAKDYCYHIPHRINEGYGMNMSAIGKLAECGVKLIITVDNGVSSAQEIRYAYELGMQVIVSDHHECRSELPDCVAVIDPKMPGCSYPFEHLAGVGVAYKLICACDLVRGEFPRDRQYLQLVAMGTVADMMPLVGENRSLVKKGLKLLQTKPIAGVSALVQAQAVSKEPCIDSTFISFNVAPRINAAGRVGDVNDAVKLLMEDDTERVLHYAEALCRLNSKRQSIENEIFDEVCGIIESTHDFANDKVIVVAGKGWHHGVVGIVSSKVTEKYKLPSVLISVEDGEGKGSARSIEGFNINQAFSTLRHRLIRFGGHELAAGLTINEDEIEAFSREINDYARDKITESMLEGTLRVDMAIDGYDLTVDKVEALSLLEPYGCANPTPLLYLKDVRVLEIVPVGQNRHTRLTIEKDSNILTALVFGTPVTELGFSAGDFVDLAVNAEINVFLRTKSVRLIVRDIKLTDGVAGAVTEAHGCFREDKIPDTISAKCVPDVAEMRKFFVRLKSNVTKDTHGVAKGNLMLLLENKGASDTEISVYTSHIRTSLMKMVFMLMIFREMGLCHIELTKELDYTVTFAETNGKVDIETSVLLGELRKICTR